MQHMRALLVFLFAGCAMAQKSAPASDDSIKALRESWKRKVETALSRRSAMPSGQDAEPVISKPQDLMSGVKQLLPPALPPGSLTLRDNPKDASSIVGNFETEMQKTDRGRVVERFDLTIDWYPASAPARERLVNLLCAPAVFSEGPLEPPDVGQLSYHMSDNLGANTFFIRQTAVVSLHCNGPYFIPNPGGPPQSPPPMKDQRTQARHKCQELAVGVDRLLLDALK